MEKFLKDNTLLFDNLTDELIKKIKSHKTGLS